MLEPVVRPVLVDGVARLLVIFVRGFLPAHNPAIPCVAVPGIATLGIVAPSIAVFGIAAPSIVRLGIVAPGVVALGVTAPRVGTADGSGVAVVVTALFADGGMVAVPTGRDDVDDDAPAPALAVVGPPVGAVSGLLAVPVP